MESTKITRNYQITIPREIREKINLKIGDKLIFIEKEKRIEIKKIEEDIFRKTAGLWKNFKETGIEYERRLRKEWEKRL